MRDSIVPFCRRCSAMPAPNKIRTIPVERLAGTKMRTNMDTNWEQEQVAKAQATREHASRVADRERDTRAAAAALGSSTPGRSSTSSSVPYKRAPGEAKPPPPMPKSTAASSGHASLPPPVAAGQSLPVLMGPPAKAGPPASAASSDPVGANSAPGSSTPGAGNPGKGWSGPLPGKRGPNLGGRIGTAAETTRGHDKEWFIQLANRIADILE